MGQNQAARRERRWQAAICAGAMVLLQSASPAGAAAPPATRPFADSANDAAPAPRLPVPEATSQAKALTSIRGLFRDDYVHRAAEGRRALAGKLLEKAAQTTDDPTSRYVLLKESCNVAADAGEVDLSFKAIDVLAHDYEVDATDARRDTLFRARSAVRPSDATAFVDAGLRAANEAAAAGRYDVAQRMADAVGPVAARSGDKALADRARTAATEMELAAKESLALAKQRHILQTDPADPPANAAVGRFLCLIRGDWAKGLPMLERGDDEPTRRLALQESQLPQTTAAQIELADGWVALSEKQREPYKTAMRQHAATWYRAAEKQATGLTLDKIKARLKSFDSGAVTTQSINLLAAIDPAKDTVAGEWSIREGVLVAEAGALARLEIPYRPTGEYDFLIEFDQPKPSNGAYQILTSDSTQFTWGMGVADNTLCGLGQFADDSKNPTHVKFTHFLPTGKRVVSVVQVRRGSVRAFVNGRLISQWKGEPSAMTLVPAMRLRAANCLGLGSGNCQTRFYRVEVVEMKGAGKWLRERKVDP